MLYTKYMVYNNNKIKKLLELLAWKVDLHFSFLWYIYKRYVEYDAIYSISNTISDIWSSLKTMLAVL